jgi:hypothetical protein
VRVLEARIASGDGDVDSIYFRDKVVHRLCLRQLSVSNALILICFKVDLCTENGIKQPICKHQESVVKKKGQLFILLEPLCLTLHTALLIFEYSSYFITTIPIHHDYCTD